MSRCRCCDKELSTPELLSSTLMDEGFCWTCNSASFDKYNIVSDREYVGGEYGFEGSDRPKPMSD